MRFHSAIVVLASVLFTGATPARAESATEPCARVRFEGKDTIRLTDSERVLICGSSSNPAWQNVPDSQVVFHLKAFLQSRGYYHARFEFRGDKVFVILGEQTRIKTFTIEGGTREVDPDRVRRVRGEILTPALLNSVTERLTAAYLGAGYPCPRVSVQASYDSGELIATVESGPRLTISKVTHEEIPDVDETSLSRYHAFRVGDLYNSNYLSLTNQRILDDAVVQSSYFATHCAKDGAEVTQKFVAGPPRLLRFGIGIDTEQLVVGRASWRSSRLGNTASHIELSAKASIIAQDFTAQSAWYPYAYHPRFSLRPMIRAEHNNPAPYEEIAGKFRLAPTLSVEGADTSYLFSVAPSLTFTKTLRGVGPGSRRYLSMVLAAEARDHLFELYRNSPRSGWEAMVDVELAHASLWSDITAQRVHFSTQKLWNAGAFDPPFLILGVRADGGVIISETDPRATSTLPLGYLFFLGGSPDLRGFSLRELPADGRGALTYFTTSFEARFADLLPFQIQPFAFIDFGMLGQKEWTLEKPLLWSPGLGVRWESPIGVLRTTLAKGMFDPDASMNSERSHWQFYLSLGEEF